MRVVLVGGHGKIALLLAGLLSERGDEPVALIRNPAHGAEVAAAGARAVLLDVENTDAGQLAAVLDGADAVVFAAGAGAGSGAARKYTVDRDGSVLAAGAAEAAGVRRFLQISSMGAGEPAPDGTDEVWRAYLDAKTQAEDDLRGRDLDWTVLRPGRLTDDPATGAVTIGQRVGRSDIPRADVAAVLVALLDAPETAGATLEVVAGETPIAAAISALR
ncbi:NAD(P)H-binding protein [Nocardia asteroides]|uniref:NAD(P)H-binding protein n=1 Tax=Nocardia asteroides TaxID=1824 RepID=UPI001E298962|nr:NAD(P)H-binding protein [Nocardia asteroides]UGT61589.1 NAD(P)H-binding protein [Nocardia asteroides]